MPKKENDCQHGVCRAERDLLDSLSTRTARIPFQALASNHPILNHFDSPAWGMPGLYCVHWTVKSLQS